MVRTPPARAHPSLHREAAARGDRAGAGARLPALPVRMAARPPEARMQGPGRGGGRASRSSKASRHPRARGKPKSFPRASPSTSPPGSTSIASPGVSSGRASRRARAGSGAGRGAGALDADHVAGAAQRAAVVCVRRRARSGASDGARRGTCGGDPVAWRVVLRRDRGAHAPAAGQVEEALAELVALGLVNSDSFGGLRALLVPRIGDARALARAVAGVSRCSAWPTRAVGRSCGGRRCQRFSSERFGGSLESAATTRRSRNRAHAAQRWGVVFWKLLARRGALAAAVARHPDVLPAAGGAWRDSRRPLRRRLLGRAVRDARSREPAARHAQASRASAATHVDFGSGSAQSRRRAHARRALPALTGNRVLYRDGMPIAVFAAR